MTDAYLTLHYFVHLVQIKTIDGTGKPQSCQTQGWDTAYNISYF